ncbi:MAG TPA: hypothetical protein VLH08_19860 [Acidobacteriota bacterium]|nr:hypothetical protein [Acidobacteriota bacterium]
MFVKHRKLFVILIVLISFLSLGFGKSTYSSLKKWAQRAYKLAANGKVQVVYTGRINATGIGKPAIGMSAQSTNEETQIVLLLGRLIVKGKITPQTAGAALPTKLRLIVKHNSPGGATLSTSNYDINVQSDGTILLQNLAVTDFEVFSVRDVLNITLVPVDKPLPAGNLIFNATHSLGALASTENLQEEFTPSAVPQLVYTYVNYLEDRSKGESLGPYILKVQGQPGFTLNGTIKVSGKITPFDPEPIPTTLMATVKHKNAKSGQVLSTQSSTVKVQLNGQILLQSFPFTTLNATGTAESLEVSIKPIDKAFPYSLLNCRVSYTPSTP